jgi:hypothetical protein
VRGEWMAGTKGRKKPLKEAGVKPLTCAHLWAAVLDEVAKWISAPSTTELIGEAPADPNQGRRTKGNTVNEDAQDDDDLWSWAVPDLSVGSEWFDARAIRL